MSLSSASTDIPHTITCNCGKITKEAKREKIYLSIEKAYEENQDRIFEAYATYEEIDKQGDLVKADGIADAIPIWLDRGGTLLDSHTNKHIGKRLEYDSQSVKGKRAVWLKSSIFSGRLAHNIDDEAWRKIQSGEYKGLSIGAQTFTKFRECNDKRCYNVIPSVQLYEISVVRDPANSGALIITKENMEVTKVPETETVEETKKEDVKVGNAKLDIFVHTVANQPAPQDITKQDDKHEDDCKCGKHEEVLKSEDFCQCEDSHIDLGKSSEGDGGSQYVDLFLSLNQKLDGLTKELSDLKLEKAKKMEDEDEEEEESKTKKKGYGKKMKEPHKKMEEDEEEDKKKMKKPHKKMEEDEEEDEKKTTEDGLTSEPKGTKKKKGLTKSTTPRPGTVGDNPETSLGSSADVTKSPMMMEDIIKLTEGNNVNKAFQKIDDMVYKHQAEGDS